MSRSFDKRKKPDLSAGLQLYNNFIGMVVGLLVFLLRQFPLECHRAGSESEQYHGGGLGNWSIRWFRGVRRFEIVRVWRDSADKLFIVVHAGSINSVSVHGEQINVERGYTACHSIDLDVKTLGIPITRSAIARLGVANRCQ